MEEMQVNKKPMISNKKEFMEQAVSFLDTIFANAVRHNLGKIEIMKFENMRRYFCSTTTGAAELAYDFCNEGYTVKFGVNPKKSRMLGRHRLEYLTAFHVDLKTFKPYDKYNKKIHIDDLIKIEAFFFKPSIVVDTGSGYSCYWIPEEPLEIKDDSVSLFNNINEALGKSLGANLRDYKIDSTLIVPGTYQFLERDNIFRKTSIISSSNIKYTYNDILANYSIISLM